MENVTGSSYHRAIVNILNKSSASSSFFAFSIGIVDENECKCRYSIRHAGAVDPTSVAYFFNKAKPNYLLIVSPRRANYIHEH